VLAQPLLDKLGPIHIGDAERGLLETIYLLLTSIVCVPAVCKLIPGGSPVLGYLIGGALVGPHALNLISDVHHVQHLAELGVVFLLFTIGLELSLERLQSMAKYVFGMGAAQTVLTLLGVAGVAMAAAGLPGPSAIILGGALAMSTTAVAIQVLEDRGEMGSRHGRATFSVLLFQDLAVVVLLMLIPLLAPDPTSGSSGGAAKIAQALGIAAVKACVCIVGIIAGGRIFIRPLYKKISNLANAEIFAATTLLVVLGTSMATQLAGLSLALGAFLAGLLIAETEFALQVESDILPFKGLLMGLFFMTVGMQISVGLFAAQWKSILSAIVVLVAGKLAVMMAAGGMFGLSRMAALRSGLLLSTGGEFAFVAFGEAVAKGVLPAALTSQLYLVVALSMALVPYLASAGAVAAAAFDRSDVKAMQPDEGETKELRNHVIIAGYGRVGQMIGQMLSEELIPFVAVDIDANRVQAGRDRDLPIYFGDAGSSAVLHAVGAERAACAVITLDTPGANYRSVWAMHKHYPHVKTYVRAHDINHGLNLEKAGATVVVPETLEPSLQLAAAVLSELNLPHEEVTATVDNFRKKHIAELQTLAREMGTSLGYIAPRDTSAKDKEAAKEASKEGGGAEGAADGGVPALSPMPA
jgi:monovalent cation:proton antiporter-2 (CPA2) family protein